jgi:hypothetical protein
MMQRLRHLARHVNILNALLAALVAIMLSYALFPVLSAKVAYRPNPRDRRQITVAPDESRPAQVPSPSDYMVVAQNNVFHPERKIPPEKDEEKELPKPELVLYGTIISPDLTVAYVIDKKAPYSTPGREKRQRVLKKGDMISGFVLKEIETSRITLVRNGEVIRFNLETEKEREGATRTQASATQKGTTVSVAPSPVAPERKTTPAASPAKTPSPLDQVNARRLRLSGTSARQ